MQEHTRRSVLKGTAGLIAGSIAGCTARASDSEQLPTTEGTTADGMTVSGAGVQARAGHEPHTIDVARQRTDGTWVLDVIDVHELSEDHARGDLRAEDLEEGGTVVVLAAHNRAGVVVSPDAERVTALNDLLPD